MSKEGYDEEAWWYTANVLEVQSNKFRIIFDDGDQSWVTSEQLKPIDIVAGCRVSSRWNQGPSFFLGTASVVQGDKLHIQYDDGDQEWTTFKWIRVDRGIPPSLVPKTDRTAENSSVPFQISEPVQAPRRASQSQAHTDTAVQILIVTAVIATWGIGALFVFSELGKEAGIVWNLLFLGGAWAFHLYRQSTMCPKCQKHWACTSVGRRLIDRTGGYQTVVRQDEHKNLSGEVIGRTERREQVHVVNESYLDFYQCKHCRHEWTGTSRHQREG